MKWKQILELLDKNVELYKEPETVRKIVDDEMKIAHQIKMLVPEVEAVFVTGFPWYIVSTSMRYPRVLEIWRHTKDFCDKAYGYLQPHEEYTAIDEYINKGKGSTFKEFFKGYEGIDPHDIFETLFDYDFFFVVDGDEKIVGEKIWSTLRDLGVYSAENNPKYLIDNYPKSIPVDANVVSTKKLKSLLKQFGDMCDEDWVSLSGTASVEWGGIYDRTWGFGLDMILSFTEIIVNRKIQQQLMDARSKFASKFTFEDVLFDIRELSLSDSKQTHLARIARLLEDPYIRNSVKRRFSFLFETKGSALSWYRKLYVSLGREEKISLYKNTLVLPRTEIEQEIKENRGRVGDDFIMEFVIPLLLFYPDSKVRHICMDLLKNIQDTSYYSFKNIFEYLLDVETSNVNREMLRTLITEAEGLMFLDEDLLEDIKTYYKDLYKDFWKICYNKGFPEGGSQKEATFVQNWLDL